MSKKFKIAIAVMLSFITFTAVDVFAQHYVTNGYIRVFQHGSRPLIGNIRGEANVTISGAVNAIRGRVRIYNRDSGGRHLSISQQAWYTNETENGFHMSWWNGVRTSRFIGESRHGVVTAEGSHRRVGSQVWNPIIVDRSQSW